MRGIMRVVARAALLLALVSLQPAASAADIAAPGTLRLQIGQQPPLTILMDSLRAQAEGSLSVQWERGTDIERAEFAGATVRSLLTLLGIPSGTQLRGPWHAVVVTAIASDGYQVSFGIGELDPTLTGRKAIVAWARDGQLLKDGEGPLRLVIEGDRRPSRSVRQLVALTVSEPAGSLRRQTAAP